MTGRPRYPLQIARTTAEAALAAMAAERDSQPDAYWAGVLAEHLRQMLDSTAPEPPDLAAAEADPANPYGSTKHGDYSARSAGEVAADVPGHLPQHKGGKPECTLCGVVHDWAPDVTR